MKLIRSFQDAANTYLVLELCAVSLFDIVHRNFNPLKASFYIAELAQAVQSIHDLEIIHCDLNPSNIMVTMSGHLKLTDFGMAKDCTQNNRFANVGTEGYKSPEMSEGKEYSYPTDWYAVGIISSELCSNRDTVAKDFVDRLTAPSPSARMNFHELRNHEFLKHIDWERIKNRSYEPPFIPGYINSTFAARFDAPSLNVAKSLIPDETLSGFEYDIADTLPNQVQEDSSIEFHIPKDAFESSDE